jgi:hypothetical protein
VWHALFCSMPGLRSTPVTLKCRLNTQSCPRAPLPICSKVRGGSSAAFCMRST